MAERIIVVGAGREYTAIAVTHSRESRLTLNQFPA